MQRSSTSLGVSLQFADYIAQYYLFIALVHLSRLLSSCDSHVTYIARGKATTCGSRCQVSRYTVALSFNSCERSSVVTGQFSLCKRESYHLQKHKGVESSCILKHGFSPSWQLWTIKHGSVQAFRRLIDLAVKNQLFLKSGDTFLCNASHPAKSAMIKL